MGCRICISHMNLSPAKKNLLIIQFNTSFFKCICNNSKYSNKYIRVTTVFIYHYINNGPRSEISPIISNNLSASLINLDFLPLHTIYFDKSITPPLFAIVT